MFVKDKDGNKLPEKLKPAKHHLSLWRDETLRPKELEKDEDIFTIIMPWFEDLNITDTIVKKPKPNS